MNVWLFIKLSAEIKWYPIKARKKSQRFQKYTEMESTEQKMYWIILQTYAIIWQHKTKRYRDTNIIIFYFPMFMLMIRRTINIFIAFFHIFCYAVYHCNIYVTSPTYFYL